MVSVANLERSHFFSCLYGKSKEVYEKSCGASITGGGSASPLGAVASAKAPKTVRVIAEGEDFKRRSRSYVFQRVDDNAFHQPIPHSYGRGRGVARGLDPGVLLGRGVGLGVAVGVFVGAGVAVGVAVAVAVAVALAVAVGVDVGV